MVFHPNQSRHRSTMPIDQRPARTSALASHAAAARTVPTSSHATSLRAYTRHVAAGVRKFHAIIGVSGSTTLLVGVVSAFSCTAWAIQLDVPYPTALLAGYITVAASACVCAALVTVRNSAAKPDAKADSKLESKLESKSDPKRAPKSDLKAEPIRRNAEPDYAAWQRVGKLRVADASRLWCGIEPGHHATPEVMAWACAILDAIERDELPKSESTAALAQYKIGWHTEVRRDALQAWAKSKGHAPRFLSD